MIEDADNQGSRGPAALGSELDGDPFDGGRKRRDAATRRPVLAWLAWLAGLVVVGIALHFLLMLRTGDAPPRPSFLALRAPTFEIEMPRAGRDRLLSVAEIRWCLREDVRIEVLQQRLATQEPQRLNVMMSEYNRRCTRFKYGDDDLEHARRDIDDARRWIVEEALGEAYAPSASTTLAAAGYSLLIQDVQELLGAVGHDPGPIDGHYGARTKAAVEAFEKDSGRSPTGAISEALRRELLDRARSAGLAGSHLLRATTAERAAIRASCAGARGVASYNRCVESELVALAQRRPPPARRLTEAERAVIDDVCLRAKLRGGEAGFARCVEEQLADLAQLENEPSIAAMTEAERAAVTGRCASTGSFYGPAAFYRCAQERLAEMAQPGGRSLL